MGLDRQKYRLDREQEKESKDIQCSLGTTATMLDEKRGWRDKQEYMYSDLCSRKIILATESGGSSKAIGVTEIRRGARGM